MSDTPKFYAAMRRGIHPADIARTLERELAEVIRERDEWKSPRPFPQTERRKVKLVKLSQPSDYRFQGRSFYVNPDDVMQIVGGESYNESVVILRDGNRHTVSGCIDVVADMLKGESK